ncbi:DUF4115 domain-containing protein [Shewanella sp. AS1]|uniref:RodZ domain-containing protein n=1 Tax=Shewanella sp. AS1 TaxID=2907626 RepID=UPI001F36CB2E|nr:RodZ domain-containing protein [Shewanella sp. AS1]MCE9679224.1 DUF4115 domain-containing protein [Shewanella sp. AS1]
MTDNQIDMLKDDEAASQKATPKLGELLKTAREAKGLSVGQIAQQLHLRPSIVAAIELDDFSEIASATYVKGYVKNYARLVDVDKEAIDAALAFYFPVVSAPTMQSFSRKTTHEARDGRLMLATYLIIFVLLALLVVWWLQKSAQVSGVDMSQLTAEEVAELEQESQRQQLLTDDGQIPSKDGTAEAQTGIEPMQEVEQEEQAPEPDTSAAESDAEAQTLTAANELPHDVLLRMELTADCWIKITDAVGKTLVNDLKVGGSAINVAGQEPFEVILGAPQALTMTINGENVDLTKYPKGRVARLTLSSSANL